MFWLAPVFQSRPQQQSLDWCLTGRNGWARWSQGLLGICVFNLVWYFANTSGLKCFLLLGNRVGLVIVPRIVLLTDEDESDVEVSDRYLSLLASSSSTLWLWPTWYPQIIGTKVGLSGSGPQSVSHVQYLGMKAVNKQIVQKKWWKTSISIIYPSTSWFGRVCQLYHLDMCRI